MAVLPEAYGKALANSYPKYVSVLVRGNPAPLLGKPSGVINPTPGIWTFAPGVTLFISPLSEYWDDRNGDTSSPTCVVLSG